MKITARLVDKLVRLRQGESLPVSAFNADLLDALSADGVIAISAQGSRRSVAVIDREEFVQALSRFHEGLGNLDQLCVLKAQEESSVPARASQAAETGNSKVVAARSFTGFLVNSYEPISASLGGAPYVVNPAEGSANFIMDWRGFVVPEEVVIVGVENAENFRYVRQQRWLFDLVLPNRPLLFVSRYPQQQSHDLREWLLSVSNSYVHFGDLDLAGVNIYLTEFFAHLGSRASFLVPPDFEKRILMGSSDRYYSQYRRFRAMSVSDHRVSDLVECIHRCHKGYDQEGYLADLR